MQPTLPDLQRQFAAWLTTPADESVARIAVYRHTVQANYRNALAASYPVVRALTGAPFFDTLVDAYVHAHPSTSGDLNLYGGLFGAFIAQYPHGCEVPYLADVARLEWSIDEAYRAAESGTPPEALALAVAALSATQAMASSFTLHASCNLLQSPFPVLHIWKVHHQTPTADAVDFTAGGDRVLVHRESGAVVMETLTAGEFAWLSGLAAGADLGGALDMALAVDSHFDLRTAIARMIGNGTLVAVGGGAVPS